MLVILIFIRTTHLTEQIQPHRIHKRFLDDLSQVTEPEEADCSATGDVELADKTGCKSCPAGTYANKNTNACDHCALNYYSEGSVNECTVCDTGKGTLDTGSSIAADCIGM